MTDRNERVEALLTAWVLDRYRDAETGHLAECPDATVVERDVYDSIYGCDTGCEYLRVEARITCPHHQAVDWEDGDFAELADVIKDLEVRDQKAVEPSRGR
jgi:hypothetical protein